MSIFSEVLYNIVQKRVKSGYSYHGFPVYNLSESDAEKLESVANKYGFPPEWMANQINFESAGTFNPAIQNSIGATGLIQFMPSTAIGLGTTTNALKNMTFKEQMDYVDKYLSNFFYGLGARRGLFDTVKQKVNNNFTQTDLFMIIFYPDSVGRPDFVFPENVSRANNGITKPSQYTEKALSASTSPFRDALSIIGKAGQVLEEKTTSFAKAHWFPITLTLFGVSGLIYFTFFYKKN